MYVYFVWRTSLPRRPPGLMHAYSVRVRAKDGGKRQLAAKLARVPWTASTWRVGNQPTRKGPERDAVS